MAYSIFIRLWALLPKHLLFILAAILTVSFIVYFKGVSDGREPFRQAAQKLEIKAKIITNQTKIDRTVIKQKGAKANVEADKFVCSINSVTADGLSNLKP
ncbi:MAG: hypothetical protein HRU28_00070 [Rhizobiales bacterium]|nr:hypothetical protein [Hyphomicrobiales bacterium]